MSESFSHSFMFFYEWVTDSFKIVDWFSKKTPVFYSETHNSSSVALFGNILVCEQNKTQYWQYCVYNLVQY